MINQSFSAIAGTSFVDPLHRQKDKIARNPSKDETFVAPTISHLTRAPICPEVDLKDHSCVDVDVTADCGFSDFLEPNEGTPEGLAPHLDLMSRGLIVAVGTERCFFGLLLSNPTKCEGMVVRDINPRVKAYVDFNILLLRISCAREEYCSLATKPANERSLEVRLTHIREKIKTTLSILPFRKEYYQKHLKAFADVYFNTSKEWVSKTCFSKVNYFNDNAQFSKLQEFANAGKIVATIGSITDLSFLRNRRVAIIDTSNVNAYCVLDIQGFPCTYPTRLIWTGLRSDDLTTYRSFTYSHVTTAEREELTLLVAQWKKANGIEGNPHGWEKKLYTSLSLVHSKPDPICAREALAALKKWLSTDLYEIPGFGVISMRKTEIEKMKKVPLPILKQVLKDPNLKRFVDILVESFRELGKLYLDFIDVPGWKDTFEKKILHDDAFAPENLFSRLQKDGILQRLLDSFGRNRIALWPERFRTMVISPRLRPQLRQHAFTSLSLMI